MFDKSANVEGIAGTKKDQEVDKNALGNIENFSYKFLPAILKAGIDPSCGPVVYKLSSSKDTFV
jgi:hypothetical protein